MKHLFIALIHFYRRVLSPLKPPTCRFYPTCSEYGLVAFKRYGVLVGGWYTFVRILKCHPFHPGGFDEVPSKRRACNREAE